MRRSPLRSRPLEPSPPRPKSLGRTHTAGILEKLRRRYPPGEWALFSEVRNTTGSAEVLRYADALAIRLTGAEWCIHGFEVKTSRQDFLREISDPAKSAPIKLFCDAWWLLVPAPWKRIVLSTAVELPECWGLLKVGTGAPVVVQEAVVRRAEEPTPGFLRSLLRSAEWDRSEEPGVAGAPLVPVSRPALPHHNTGLACGHTVPRPLAKSFPSRLPCFACADGLPTEQAIVEAALEEANEEQRRGHLERLTRRLASTRPAAPTAERGAA